MLHLLCGRRTDTPAAFSPPPPLRPLKSRPGRLDHSRCHEPSPAGAHGESRTAAQQRVSRGHGRYMHLRPRDDRRRVGRLVCRPSTSVVAKAQSALPRAKERDCFNSPTLRRAWPRDGPEAAICVQGVDIQCVLQFILIHAAGCALHRRTSRVIHRSKLFSFFVFSFRSSDQSESLHNKMFAK